ncbi:HAD family hydrolase [Nitrospina watsonii]|uniref:phosphoglycolate phosphatase n=1 Tax=Nitrospina watsonii TaxID=1323948 RepID=A0ABM9HB61_9BACT|nr:HAD-IA family hydrolase [Nitrospina watsonii]CAI2717363.1 Phosphoglycolate phosphatase [Nitrospina watsonii]
MTPFSLYVFDFDGTLVDTKLDIAYSVNLVLQEMGREALPKEVTFGYVGRGVRHLMTQALNGAGDGDLERAVSLFMKHYEQHLMDQTDYFPHCRDLLKHYANKQLAVVSNKPEKFVEQILVELNSRGAFQSVVGGDSFKNKKPDPMGLRHVMQVAGLKPEDVLMVGDSEVDVATARAAGVKVCGVTYGHATREEMASYQPDWLIHDIREMKRYFL